MFLKVKKDITPIKLDLQFFADGEGGADGGSEGGNEAGDQGGITQKGNTFNYTEPHEVPEYQGGLEPFEWEHQPNSSVLENNEPTNMNSPQSTEQQQVNQQQESQEDTKGNEELPEFDFGGRKVRPDDPESIKGLHGDFQHQQRTITQQQQQIQQYENYLNQLNNMGVLPNQQNQGQPNQQMNNQYAPNQQQMNQQQMNTQQNMNQQQTQEPSEERINEINNQYLDMLYDNPYEAYKWLKQQPEIQALEQQQAQEFVKPIIEPIQQERETEQKLSDMRTKYQDFNDYLPKMQELIDQRPDLNSIDQLENVYWIAKAQSLEEQPSLEQQLENPEFRQKLAQDERFRNEVLQNYQNQKKSMNQQAPPMMGNRPGGKTPTFQYKAPRNIKEAGKLVRQNIKFQ